jgi:hypothetical protein
MITYFDNIIKSKNKKNIFENSATSYFDDFSVNLNTGQMTSFRVITDILTNYLNEIKGRQHINNKYF